LELAKAHQANPQSKIYCTPTKQSGKNKEAVTLGTANTPPSKPTKKNLLHFKQGKGSKDKEAVTLRQRFKKLFRLELQSHHQAKAQREIYCTPTKQSGKGLKVVSLGTAKPPPSKPTKKNLLHLQTGQNGKG